MRDTAQAQVKTGDFISRLMMAYVGFAAFCVFTLLSPDRLMIDPKASLNMPFGGTVSFIAFMVMAPIILGVMRVYLEVYLRRWKVLDAELSPDLQLKTISPLKHPLLRIFSWFAVYFVLPALLLLFTWKAAATHVWGEVFLFLALFSAPTMFVLSVRCRCISTGMLIIFVPSAIYAVLHHEGGLPHRGLELAREDLKEAYLPAANMRNAILTSTDLSGADLSFANLVGADLAGANLTAANLTAANLTGANLQGADLTDADLSGIHMLGSLLLLPSILDVTSLTGANLTHADLARADLAVADLSGANFEGAKNIPDLSRACADSDNPPINLPDDVKRPKSWRRCSPFY